MERWNGTMEWNSGTATPTKKPAVTLVRMLSIGSPCCQSGMELGYFSVDGAGIKSVLIYV